VKQGYVEKSNPKGSKWNKRFMVLSKDGRLIYYTDKGKDAKGSIDLSGSKATTITSSKQFPFAVQTAGRSFNFSASSAEEVKDWIEKINQVVSTLGVATSVVRIKRTVTEAPDMLKSNDDPMIGEIMEYWFQSVQNDNIELGQEHIQFWFMRNQLVDDLIRNNFLSTWEKAVKGELDHWAKTPQGFIALIILLDQFSRNMYRDSPASLQGDAKCNEIVMKGLESGIYKKLPFYQQFWIGISLTRKEDIKSLDKAVSLAEELKKDTEAKGVKSKGFYATGIDRFREQRELIQKFGRFPSRNWVLGRQSTDAEVAYLTSENKFFST